MRAAFVLFTSALVAIHVAPLAAQRAEIRAHIDAYVAALSTGSPDQFERMAKEHFSPELLARTANQRAGMVTRVHDDFGALEIVNERAVTPFSVELDVHSATNSLPLAIQMDFEDRAPYRITKVGIRAGGPAGPGGGRGGPPPIAPPPINARMEDAAIASALDGYLSRANTNGDFAGVVLVARDGRQIFEKAYGVADRARQTPMTARLRFNYASIGKAFTKTAIGQLVAAGKLKLTDTVGALLPDYPNADAKPATIAQLLAFRVGVADFFGPAFDKADKSRFQSNHDYYQFVAPQPLTFLPGARTEYCNGCYVVLGEIIARVSGMPYERYVVEHVFGPAGMKTARFLAYGEPDVAEGYTRESPDAPWRSAVDRHGHHGSAAGGSYGTVRDLLAFDNAIRTHVLLDAKSTAWFFENPADASKPRAMDQYGIAGGAPGANSSLESNGVWTVVTLGNLDPPNAVRVGTALAEALYR
jgi:CubicO group peptidase (beta-lactamase class C family)